MRAGRARARLVRDLHSRGGERPGASSGAQSGFNRVSGTQARRRWSEARGVAAREQKRIGMVACEQKTGGVSKT
jgi:hypothetical protein